MHFSSLRLSSVPLLPLPILEEVFLGKLFGLDVICLTNVLEVGQHVTPSEVSLLRQVSDLDVLGLDLEILFESVDHTREDGSEAHKEPQRTGHNGHFPEREAIQ